MKKIVIWDTELVDLYEGMELTETGFKAITGLHPDDYKALNACGGCGEFDCLCDMESFR